MDGVGGARGGSLNRTRCRVDGLGDGETYDGVRSARSRCIEE